MSEINNLCYGCMCEKTHDGVCENCGYSNDAPHLPSYLAPGTLLNDRYIAGKLLRYNGEGATYIGFDKVTGTKVTIKEYMPDAICSRKKGQTSVTVDQNKLPLYKTYMSEFVELNKALMKARGMSHIQTVLDIFPQNNTAYVVFEYITGISLKNYLSNCSGELSWERVKELFPPILTTLSLVHSAGIIHRGISPHTILVTEKSELKLIDFQISAGRTTNTEIACEVYPGYSAPEQYSNSEWHGTWTDVYGISAVLYRVLTGCPPTEALARLGSDNCAEPAAINRNVPSHVSKVLMNGLKLNTSQRIQTITELVVKLFEQPKFNTAETEPVRVAAGSNKSAAVKSRQNTHVKTENASSMHQVSAKQKKKQDNKKAVIAALISCGVIIIGFGVAIMILASNPPDTTSSDPNPYSKPETTTTTTFTTPPPESSEVESSSEEEIIYICPTLEGVIYTTIESNQKYSFLKITAEYKFDDTVTAGLVITQSIKAGTEITEGTEIKLTVSKGPAQVALPDYKGMTAEEYVKLLSMRNIKFEKKELASSTVEPGYVVKCSKGVGEKVNVEKSETVTVYVAVPKKDTPNNSDDKPTSSAEEENNEGENTEEENNNEE